ncbi:hypothetical protein PBCV1_a374L [Paramecium bursaria Chlorella virus 1]|uniref:Uncharacterized protein n=1 Tax=Paramecium bursaria Chlorella virus 1 TaxID=10506 RepID=Q98426_PBCV1|nr:hypothetical protein PBCV1_a374L [Paramecium bursaria Chlorella virus 1]AAC96742.1 hypothetical protein [Paramecium bursaria Chlorella virus 1]
MSVVLIEMSLLHVSITPILTHSVLLSPVPIVSGIRTDKRTFLLFASSFVFDTCSTQLNTSGFTIFMRNLFIAKYDSVSTNPGHEITS